jgi:hypothetical protein
MTKMKKTTNKMMRNERNISVELCINVNVEK